MIDKENKNIIKLFCDGSVNPKTNVGFASYFIVENEFLDIKEENIKTKKFEDTSSTKLELQCLLWALNDLNLEKIKLIVFTDCQNILGLKSRREKLEKSSYLSKTGKFIKNKELYKEFFLFLDKYVLEFVKVKGHKKTLFKDDIDKLFNLVDKASRKALRESQK